MSDGYSFQTAKKVDQLKRVLAALQRMKDAGWLDDVSEQIRRSMLSVELKAPEAIRFAEVTGDCFTSALFLDGVRIAALIAIKGAVTSRSALTIGDDAIVLNLQVEFKDS